MQPSLFKIFDIYKTLWPKDVLQTPIQDIIQVLEVQFGPKIGVALNPEAGIQGPVAHLSHTDWLKTANTVGINVRTIGHFWTLSHTHSHCPTRKMPFIFYRYGGSVVSSLYGPCSWNLNPEFFSPELSVAFPHLDTVEKQLKVVVNFLHLLGKAVGMDVVPHTDRFSEQALANPQFFEWLQRRDLANRTPFR